MSLNTLRYVNRDFSLFILNSQVLRNRMKSREVPDYRWQLSILLMLVRLPLKETFLNQIAIALTTKSLQYC